MLSPAFDVNPTPDLYRTRSTSIAGADAFPDEVEGLLALAEDCGLTPAQAKGIMGRVAVSMSEWQAVARRSGVSEREVRVMAESISPRVEAVGVSSRRR
ncbi:hypothetical protein GCM10022198_15010 [Klugiella xanthotipulae]|uniref:HipA domain-containing protein n=1 Tax=Klugiella xanthotipulae TaxID=244735 RepID=UPI001FEBB0CE